MKSKTLFLFVILPIGIVALLVYMSVTTWRHIKTPDSSQTERLKRGPLSSKPPAAPRDVLGPSGAPIPPSPAAAVPVRPQANEQEATRLVRQGEDCERTGDWDGAHQYYSQALGLREEEGLKLRVRAMYLLITARKMEGEGKREEAIQCYTQALAYSRNAPELEKRIERLAASLLSEQQTTAGKEKEGRTDVAEAVQPPPETHAPKEEKKPERTEPFPAPEAPPPSTTEDKKATPVTLMNRLLALLSEKEMVYARIAACLVYLQDPRLENEHAALKAEQEAAVTAIQAARAGNPSPVATDSAKSTEITFNDGAKVVGMIVDSNDQWVKVKLESKGVSGCRQILRKNIASIEERVQTPQEINEARAAEWLEESIASYNARQPFDCLERLGQLLHEFAGTSLLKDKSRQKSILAKGLKPAPDAAEADLNYFLSIAVSAAEAETQRLERLCPKCGGKGKVGCPTCKGRGKVLPPCGNCTDGRIPCPTCGGKGEVPCTRCERRGTMVCPHCGGRGEWKYDRGYTTIRCARCNGKGIITCPSCTDGMAKCKDCKDGFIRCPVCKGKEIECPTCHGAKMVRCEECNGLGEIKNQPE